MPRSSGTYTLPAGNPVVTGTTITSNWANTTLSDIATALTGSVATDGSSPMTGALQMSNNKITGVADGTASSDVATVNQIANPTITGGTIDGAPIGAADPKNGSFLALTATSAALTGTCTAPTVTPSTDSSTKIATTAFVQSAITAVSSGVTSFNTRSGAVTLSSSDVTTALGYTPYNSGGATVITTSNISSYAPTVSGSGAYGTWGISISGNAATVSNGAYTNASNTFSGTNVFSPKAYFGGTSYWSVGWDGSTSLNFDYSGSTKAQFTSGGAAYNTTGTWGTISDARIKENILPARDYLNSICQLDVINYNLVGNPQKMLGFTAQQVEQVMPGLVETAPNPQYNLDDFKSIKTSVLIPMLVQAIQELNAKVTSLEEQVLNLGVQ